MDTEAIFFPYITWVYCVEKEPSKWLCKPPQSLLPPFITPTANQHTENIPTLYSALCPVIEANYYNCNANTASRKKTTSFGAIVYRRVAYEKSNLYEFT